MGEAKRRKKLDPNYGKPKLINGKSKLEILKRINMTPQQCRELEPYTRIINSPNEIDDSIDGIWIYKKDQGKIGISFTGNLAGNSFNFI